MAMVALRALLIAGLSLSFARLSTAANATNTPLSLVPSQFWDGKDGPWSTFGFTVGTPSQSVRLLPASGQSATWPILPEGCEGSDDGDFDTCSDARGYVYYINKSSTWDEEGIYELSSLWVEHQLGVGEDARGRYGFDTVGLGWQSEGLPSLEDMVVGGIADKFTYEGAFPLSPRPVNFTDLNNPHASILNTLRNESYIPSTSWAYTAGAYNHAPKIYGSLTLGGYDTTRFTPNNITMSFGSDISRDLLVAVQEVSTNLTDTPLMSTGDYWFIDSLVASMWFPTEVCTAFEEAFGIEWDDEYSIYLINDTLHETLSEQNPSLTFKLGPSTSGESVSITMPYANLALNASSPVYPNSTRYFPLKRAVNDTQYTLGRAFLQNAYVIVDYDRSNFSVSEALFPDTSVDSDIQPILAPVTTTSAGNGTTSDSDSSTLSTGAIAGIAVGAAAVLIFLLALAIWLLRRRKAAAKRQQEEQLLAQQAAEEAARAEAFRKAELDSGSDGQRLASPGLAAAAAAGRKMELEGDANAKHEMQGDDEVKAELFAPDGPGKHAEMEAQVTPVFEMPANEDVALPELESPGSLPLVLPSPRAELEGLGGGRGRGEGGGEGGGGGGGVGGAERGEGDVRSVDGGEDDGKGGAGGEGR